MHGSSAIEADVEANGLEGFSSTQKTVLMRLVESRRRRNKAFANRSKLFCDPAWDMLIDLFDAAIKGKPVSITAACAASGVAYTTALRYIRLMELEGLITRRGDVEDGRRAILLIADRGYAKMHSYVRWLENA